MRMQLSLAPAFGDHMVLQAGLPLPIWGSAPPGAVVLISLPGEQVEVEADPNGRFSHVVRPLAPGGPFELVVSCGSEVVRCSDVLAGEVWLCSGQSNMEWPLSEADGGRAASAAAADGKLRLLQVPHVLAAAPAEQLQASWQVCAPEHAATFSAVGYFFGRALRTALGVPVGLVHASWGGTPIQSWLSRGALQTLDPEIDQTIAARTEQIARQVEILEQAKPLLRTDLGFAAYADPGNVGFGEGWADPSFDDADWRAITLPTYWEFTEIGDMDGSVWFRTELTLGEEWLGGDLRLELGPIDDFDDTYWNGTRVGGIGKENPEAYRTPRAYRIDARLLHPGKNTLAVRVFDHLGLGGFGGRREQLKLSKPGTSLELGLAGEFRYRVEHRLPPLVSISAEHCPTHAYNAMIHPLAPFAMRGALWYQGESNASEAERYARLLHALVRDWRARFHPELAFLVVQLANFEANAVPGASLGESAWARIREAQASVLELPGAGLATAIDIGDINDIHPRNKREVGERLARVAEARVYGKNVPFSGPVFEACRVVAGAARVRFKHANTLRITGGGTEVLGFVIAGANRVFEPARAVIEGDEVVVRGAGVPEPVSVRYAWADNPAVNLVNEHGLPAFPFRTDEWSAG